MQFNRNVILAFSVTACAIVYLLATAEDRIENDRDIAQRSLSDNKDSSSGSRNLFSIIGMMGGELEVDDAEGPWADYTDFMTLYSSTPFNPRQYAGDDTEFLHYKDPQSRMRVITYEIPTQLPVLGAHEFGETRHPTKLPTRFPTKLPTREPSKFPTREPTKDPSRRPTPNPSRFPTKFPTREPTRDPTREPTRDPSRRPSRNPSRLPTRLPTREPTREPTKEPTRDPSRGPTRLPTRLPSKIPTRDPTREPTREPTKDPSRHPTSPPNQQQNPTSPPIQQQTAVATPNPTKRPTSGSFYCGSSVADASSCKYPCPGGISDCVTGFCYAVSQCIEQVDAAVTPDPTPNPTSPMTPATPQPTTDDFFCGSSLMEASSVCEFSCPSGSPAECPNNLTCYASTGCLEEASPSPTRSPSYDPSGSFYCGSSFQELRNNVLMSVHLVYHQIVLLAKPAMLTLRARIKMDSSAEQTLLMPVLLVSILAQVAPIEPAVDDGTKYCGYSYEHAATECTQPCESGLSEGCPEGMSCYSHTPCEEKNTFYCGISWNNAASSCRYPCPSGTDSECPFGTQCYAYTTCDETDSFMCGTTFDDASSNCDEPCPSGSPTECPSGESCFTHTTCKSIDNIKDEPTAAPVEPYVPGDSFFCGTSYLEASSQCTHPCPTRLDSECPDGEQCYGSTPCPSRDTYYCGANLDEASAICDYPCPTGSSADCPTGLSCFAFTTCADKDTFYCGNNYIEASGTCEKPCPSGKSDTCPSGMSCFAQTSCADRDSFMCGYSWESASATCSNPCPSGEHSECPDGMSCFAYTPCNNDGSYFCGTSFDEASDCQLPCPSGESSECPNDLSCFSYTTCGTGDFNTKAPTDAPTPANWEPIDSFYCGTSFDDASSSCEFKCPNGSIDCPTGLACYEYTSCVGGPSPSLSPTGERDSFYCGTNYADANGKCLVPCPGGNSNECPTGESCIPFTSCNEQETAPTPDNAISTTFYCGLDKEDSEGSCNHPCPGGTEDCPDGMSCYSFTSCVDLPYNEPTPSGTSDECPTGQSCYGYTACDDHDTFFCGTTWDEAASTCSKPCPSGSNDECDNGEICFGYTPCASIQSALTEKCAIRTLLAVNVTPCTAEQWVFVRLPTGQFCFPSTPCDETESFFCGSSFDEATSTCGIPCPTGQSSTCPNESYFCGTSFDEASSSCLHPCPSGLSNECPNGLLCFASTSCSDKGSFFCGGTWEEAASTCTLPCESGLSSDCPNGQKCFGYTPCSKSDSFYCGTSFDEASSTCTDPCPSGLDAECPGSETCHKYTPCADGAPPSKEEPNIVDIPEDSFYCGVNFMDASDRCYLPCPSGSASECPVGEACYGNTPCNGGDSFFCGNTVDFYDASTNCIKPCPTGSSSECPEGLSCFPNTPCESNDVKKPTNLPTKLPTPAPTDSIQQMSATTAQQLHVSMFLYCGTDIENVNCLLPCPNGNECPLGHECYATTECSESFYCGQTFADANSTCAQACPDGLDTSCPQNELCFAQTSCADPVDSPDKNVVDVGSFYCGKNYTDASTSCALACPSGSSSECAELGPEYSCYANTPCDDSDTYFCGTTWNHAASNCLFPCKSGLDSECPDKTFCFPYTTFEDAASCLNPCPSGSSSECPFEPDDVPNSSASEPNVVPTGAPDETDSFFCGSSFEDASASCSIPCDLGRSDEDESIEPVPSDSYFCGVSFDDASSSCTQPCPSGLSNECPNGLFCFASTSCTDKGSFFCGATWDEAASTCTLPCESGLSSDCPNGQKCFGYTPCMREDTFYCGTSFDEASSTCTDPCPSGLDAECPGSETCHKYTPCADGIPEFSTPPPDDSYYCGKSFDAADNTCITPCPSGSAVECPVGEACFAHTTCSMLHPETFFCGSSFNDASSCAVPCEDGVCPDGRSCYAYTPCAGDIAAFSEPITLAPTRKPTPKPTTSIDYPTESYYCGVSLEDASTQCAIPCPLKTSSVCPLGQSCFANTPCQQNDPEAEVTFSPNEPEAEVTFSPIPVESYYCGLSYMDASGKCNKPCSSRDSNECPGAENCYAYTPCVKPKSFFCGSSLEDANGSCTVPCPTGRSDSCPTGESCFAYTTCESDMSEFSEPALTPPPATKRPTSKPSNSPTAKPTSKPSKFPTKNPTKNPTNEPSSKPTLKPTPNPTRLPTKNPTKFPTKMPTKNPTKFPTKMPTKNPTKYPTVSPTKSPIVPVIFDVPKESFYCGANFEHATQMCGVPHVTATPTEDPTFKPSLNPTKRPTPRPTLNPTKYPTPKPTREPSPPPTVKETPPPTVKKTTPPTVKDTPPPTVKDTPPPTVKDTPPPTEKSPAESPDEEEPSEMSEAVVIELKPCDDPLAMTVNQAYWRSWSSDRPETCNRFEPSDIDDQTYTHLVYSFASISAAGHVEPWAGSWDEVEKYKEFNKVKERNPNIKTIIAVTEGVFYGGGMNPVSFTEIAETEASRMAFAQSAVSFLDMYNFDGIDLDWEAPLDRDKGGSPDNYEHFVQVAEEIRLAIDESGKDYLLTIALPGTDWEQLDYDVVALSEHVDWFNLNTFDYHTPKNIPKTVGSHSDLKMIDAVVYKLLQETISTKFVLGMAAFGRTYTLADDRCKELNCPFRSPGLGGCGNTPGFLPFAEISEYIESNSYDELHHDISSSSMVAVVDSNQMISFDNEETWAIKEAYAEMMCLRGTMLWSIDMFKAPSTPARSQTHTASCANIADMLTMNFVPQESDQCTDITSMYQDSCCAKAPTTPCNICGSDHVFEDRRVRYAGMDTTCGDISESFLQITDEHSFSCSLAKSLIPRTCCANSPVVDKIQGEVEAFIAATDDEPQPCNICHQGSLHHALKAETMVEYKGASISCLDVNSILAKNEKVGSEMCDATQSLLFKGCCYDKCSLCGGEESLNVDATVKHNGQVLSCDEMSSMFTLSVTEEGSEQCDAMQTAYASTCCYKPPERPCNLCKRGTTSYEVNTRAFVKTHSSSSSFCVDVLNELALREEEGSDTCMHSKTAYFSKCCDILSLSTELTAAEPSLPSEPKQNKPHEWLTDRYVAPPQSSGHLPSSVWALTFAALVGAVIMLF
ncbi:chitinase [Skeletonema marinoi]|uniref:Chitinase n=1 Tax=Skeletonema marinoi TaxID=267567 RepID=A0AAD9DK76_9STRA|nr:chitinase [Skeletonema marinoi]